ncbi:MAG: phosphate signaling complex protein PhoU [Phycisphaeraceae bacterium]
MSMHLQRQTDRLKKMILSLSALVEEASEGAIRAVQLRDVALAKQIIEADDRIDLMEIEVEEECLHTLALYQPVAMDLRFVVAVLKINNDLERIADLAVNVAEQAVFLAGMPRVEPPFDLATMTRKVQWMIKSSLDALVNIDTALAQEVRKADDDVDDIHRKAYTHIETQLHADPQRIEALVHFLSISRQLERMADHTVNIAEDVLYMARGDILRHSRPHPNRMPAPSNP